jgi:plastocyanin
MILSPATNLAVQLFLMGALLAGASLARARRYQVHGWVQTFIVLLNLGLILSVMLPSFQRLVRQASPHDSLYRAGIVHGLLGTLAEILGLYVVLSANNLLPMQFQLSGYRRWMRLTLAMWIVAVISGSLFYYVANVGSHPGATRPRQAKIASATIRITNFRFEPHEITIAAGDTVEWIDDKGRHTVEADDGSLRSPALTAGAPFRHQFDQPGVYRYFCAFHGSKGGSDMSGTVMVHPRPRSLR